MGFSIGADIGGTFTDFTVVDDQGQVKVFKVLTTKKDPAQAIYQGLKSLSEESGVALAEFTRQIDFFIHGTTIATNTVIQKNGPRTGLVATMGFRDVMALRDGFKWDRFNLKMPQPDPFIPRHLRQTVEERVNSRGEVVVPLNEESVRQALAIFKKERVESVAVSLLWSMVNAAHEKRIREIAAEEMPEAHVVISSEILPMIREWQRTSATVLSAYIGPGISKYMQEVESFLTENGFRHMLLIMQANGGAATVARSLEGLFMPWARAPRALQRRACSTLGKRGLGTSSRWTWVGRASTSA